MISKMVSMDGPFGWDYRGPYPDDSDNRPPRRRSAASLVWPVWRSQATSSRFTVIP